MFRNVHRAVLGICLGALALWLAVLVLECRSQRQEIARLRAALVRSEQLSAMQQMVERRQAASSAASQARRAEFQRLHTEYETLLEQAATAGRSQAARLAEIEATRADIDRLRLENEQIERSADTQQAKALIEQTRLRFLSSTVSAYAQRNEGQRPVSLEQLRAYVPADVFESLHTEQLELITNTLTPTVPNTVSAIIRSKADADSKTWWLFTDGRIEAGAEP
jgi:hypothetical protein